MSSSSTSASLAPGMVLGGYVVQAPLGTGGMGEVWRAHDPNLLRDVALKVLSPEAAQDPSTRARFVREGRAAAALVHPNVVTVFGAGEEAGRTYLAMELVVGRTFRLAAPEAPPLQRLAWLLDLARALGAVHRAGFVHRDVKPDNVMVDVVGRVKLLDFGIARVDPTAPGGATDVGGLARTGTNQIVGTPRYIAPEQWRGSGVDPRTDQFAWGLVAYEALAGLHPDDASPAFGRVADWRGPATPLHAQRPDLPFGVSAIVTRALALAPEHRFRTMDDLAAELEACIASAEATGPSHVTPGPLAATRPDLADATRREPRGSPTTTSTTRVEAPPRSHALVFVTALLAVPVLALAAGGIHLATSRAPDPTTIAATAPDANAGAARDAASSEGDAAAPPPAITAEASATAVADAGAPRPRPPPTSRCGRYTSATVSAAGIPAAASGRSAWEAATAGPLLACARAAPEAYCTGTTWSIGISIEDHGSAVLGYVATLKTSSTGDEPPYDTKLMRCIARAIAVQAPPPKNEPRYGGWLVVRFGT